MPFRLSSNSAEVYLGPHYRQVYQELFDGIRSGNKVLLLSGEAGAGKTTLMDQVVRNLTGMIRPVRIQQGKLDFESILDSISAELGYQHMQGAMLSQKMSDLSEFLSRQSPAVVIVIDRAHQISDETYTYLASLLESEAEHKSSVQLVLLGAPELETSFRRAALKRLDHDSVIYCYLEPLEAVEVEAYIAHCLAQAGGVQSGLFSSEALERVMLYSRGLPLSINTLCGGALLTASLEEQPIVSAEMIDEAAQHCQLMEDKSHQDSDRPASLNTHTDDEPSAEDNVFLNELDEDIDTEASVSKEKEVELKLSEIELRDGEHSASETDSVYPDDLDARFNRQTEIYEVDLEQKTPYGKILAAAGVLALLIGGGFFLAFQSSQLMSEQVASLNDALDAKPVIVQQRPSVPTPATVQAQSEPGLPASQPTSQEAEVFAAMETAPAATQKSPESSDSIPLIEPQSGRTATDSATQRQVLQAQAREQLDAQSLTDGLLLRAEQQMAAKKLMTPEDDNALQTYQQLLEQVPDQPQALAGIARIRHTYARWARYEVKKNNLKHARYLYKKALKVSPGDSELTAELDRLNTDRVSLKPESGSDASDAGQDYSTRERVTVPESLPTLLRRAGEQVANRQLLTPQRDNAVATYRKVLQLYPGNPEALDGLNQIKQIYTVWADSEQQKGNWQRARMFYERALQLAPWDEAINKKMQSMP